MLKATTGVVETAVDGTDYFSGSYGIPNANIRNGLSNANIALQTQTMAANTNYYITRSNINLPATFKTTGGIEVGTRFTWEVGMMKTNRSSTSFSIVIFRGTNGTTADTADVTQSIGTPTAVADSMRLIVQVVITATGVSGSYYWTMVPVNKLTTATGFGIPIGTTAYRNGTVSGVNLTTTSLIFGLGFRCGSNAPVITIPYVLCQTANLC
jgi:hypothetical protein